MFNVVAELNWIAILVAFVVYFVLGALWFVFLFPKAYNVSLGREATAKPDGGTLSFVGPAMCVLINVVTSAILIAALNITTYTDALQFGTIVGVGYLVAMTFNIAINPNFPRPIMYGLVNAPYFLLASWITSAILVAFR